MSTFSSRVIPVLTSNSSGARYAIVLCSAAISCWSSAWLRFSTLTRAFMQLPKSMRIGRPSSEIMTFLRNVRIASIATHANDAPWFKVPVGVWDQLCLPRGSSVPTSTLLSS